MMNKSVVILRSNPVNPDSRVEKEANSLSKNGYCVRVIAWDRYNTYKIKNEILVLEDSEVEIIRFGILASFGEGFKNLGAFIRFQIRIFKWLIENRDKYSVIHACDFDTALTSFICSKIVRKKLIFDIFDFLYSNPQGNFLFLKKIINFLQKYIISKSDGTIICSEERMKQIRGAKPSNIIVVHNSPAESTTKDVLSLKGGKVKLVYVGILQEHRFLEELAEVVIGRCDYELHIGGFGKYEQYFERLSEVHSNILYYGKLSYKDTIRLERSCDIMTAIYAPQIDNHRFAAPNKFYEALMLGKQLIMINGTGMSDIVKQYGFGEVINYDKVSLENGIDRIISKKNDWDNIAHRMREMYFREYKWGIMEKRILNLYFQICKS